MDEENTNTDTPAEATATATPEAAPAGNEGGDGKRPVFLTVLCILTFIGSGLGTLFGILGIVGASFLGDLMNSIPGMGAAMGATTGFMIVTTVLAAASLFGAIQMWKLKKMGFFIYAGANIIAPIATIVMLGGGFAIMSFLWPVVFIVLYGLNLKHLS